MGIRVSFYVGAAGGLEEHLAPHVADYHAWYAKERELEDPQGILRADVCDLLGKLAGGGRPPVVRTLELAELVDRLVADFYGFYCDAGPGQGLLRPVRGTSDLYKRHYEELEPRVALRHDKLLDRYWSYILRGRGVWRSPELDIPFVADDSGFSVGYLTLEECAALCSAFAASGRPLPVTDEVQHAAFRSAWEAVHVAVRDEHGLILLVA